MAVPDFIIIAGPTASGKSALAVALARRVNGIIINADSMQVYAGLPILTAMPTATDLASVPHYLFGQHDPTEPYSVGAWLRDACDIYAKHACAQTRPGIFVGGSGLYIRAALNGIAPIPAIPQAIRQRARDRLADVGAVGLHAELSQHDPHLTNTTQPQDKQRLVRGMEVWLATGKPLSQWQQAAAVGKIPGQGMIIYIRPPRAVLYDRINQRFRSMLAHGALDEIRALCQRPIPADAPIWKAVGVPPLMAVLAGTLTKAEATELAMRDCRRYAKRQYTWFDHQLDRPMRLDDMITQDNVHNFAKRLAATIAHE